MGKVAPPYAHPLGDLGLITCCGPYGRGRVKSCPTGIPGKRPDSMEREAKSSKNNGVKNTQELASPKLVEAGRERMRNTRQKCGK